MLVFHELNCNFKTETINSLNDDWQIHCYLKGLEEGTEAYYLEADRFFELYTGKENES